MPTRTRDRDGQSVRLGGGGLADNGGATERPHVEGLVSVLLVEDDPDDVEITKRAFHKGKILNPLYVARDGEQAIEFLQRARRSGSSTGAAPLGLILLDLNLPRVDGREVLRFIKNTPGLKRIPVVVLTTSDNEADIRECYDWGANSYMAKPVDFRKFVDTVVAIGHYWLCLAEISGTRK